MTHINPDLIKLLRAQYGHECRVCGAEMGLQDSRDMVFACVPVSEPDPTRPGSSRWKDGRSFLDKHYCDSRMYIRTSKDPSVIAVLDRLATLEAEVVRLRATEKACDFCGVPLSEATADDRCPSAHASDKESP